MAARKKVAKTAPAPQAYSHPEATSPARPAIRAQAHFKKTTAPSEPGEQRRIAVKLIDPRGNELLALKKLEVTK